MNEFNFNYSNLFQQYCNGKIGDLSVSEQKYTYSDENDLGILLEYIKIFGEKCQAFHETQSGIKERHGFTIFYVDEVAVDCYKIPGNEVQHYYITDDGKMILFNDLMDIEKDLTCKTKALYPRNFKEDLQNIIKDFKAKKLLNKKLESELKLNNAVKNKKTKI